MWDVMFWSSTKIPEETEEDGEKDQPLCLNMRTKQTIFKKIPEPINEWMNEWMNEMDYFMNIELGPIIRPMLPV